MFMKLPDEYGYHKSTLIQYPQNKHFLKIKKPFLTLFGNCIFGPVRSETNKDSEILNKQINILNNSQAGP